MRNAQFIKPSGPCFLLAISSLVVHNTIFNIHAPYCCTRQLWHFSLVVRIPPRLQFDLRVRTDLGCHTLASCIAIWQGIILYSDFSQPSRIGFSLSTGFTRDHKGYLSYVDMDEICWTPHGCCWCGQRIEMDGHSSSEFVASITMWHALQMGLWLYM